MFFGLYKWLEGNSWIVAMNSSKSGSALLEVTHYFGFFLLIGATTVVDLRLLGIGARSQKLKQLAQQVSGMMWTGMIVSLLSGFIMFAGSATQYYSNSVFYEKVVVVLVAIAAGVVIDRNVPDWDQLPSAPAAAKILAFASIALWIGAIVLGVEVPALTGVG